MRILTQKLHLSYNIEVGVGDLQTRARCYYPRPKPPRKNM